MKEICPLNHCSIWLPKCLSILGLVFLASSSVYCQGDRTDRLQEKVKTTDERIDVRKVESQSRRVNSPAFQGVRKAEKRVALAKQTLSDIENKASIEKASQHRGQRAEAQSENERSTRTRAARNELEAAQAQLKEAKKRLESQ
jgi:hypothetical protein